MRTVGTRWVTLRSIFAFAALLAAAAVHAQSTITIRVANSVNDQIVGVTFVPPPPATTPPLNNDGATLGKLVSLALATNPNAVNGFSVDLYAADSLNHHILDYVGDFCAASVNTSACTQTGTIITQAAAINYPNGLSVDTAGNLFALNDAPGKSPQPQVWVIPSDGAGGFITPAGPIDTTSPGGSLGAQQAVVETMIVGAPLGKSNCGQPPCAYANVGDLLVVSNNPDSILLYHLNPTINDPLHYTLSATPLIPQCPKPHGSSNCIPGGSLPQGIALWPADNSLLITVSGGMILRFNLTGGTVNQMTSIGGLPAGLVKIKTAVQKAGAVGYVAMSGSGNHGSIVELLPAASNNIQVGPSVSSGIAAPQGLAVTSAAQIAAVNCQFSQNNPNGCDPLGDQAHNVNVLTHIVKNVTGSLQGNLIEDVCIVGADPRPPSPSGVCGDVALSVNQVCPGYDNTGRPPPGLVIPGYLCGGSGFGTGFALIRTLTTHAVNPTSEWNGTYVESTTDSTQLLPGNNNPVCGPPSTGVGIGTLVWAPLKNEGAVDEGSFMVDITDGCGTGHGGTGYTSLWAIGLALDTTAHELQPGVGGNVGTPLENFVQPKHTHLKNTITAFTPGNITSSAVSQALYNNNSNNSPGCIDLSLAAFTNATTVDAINSPQWIADLQNAANLLANDDLVYNTTCDSIVTNPSNTGSFVETNNPLVVNPSGQIRSRLANIYYTINTDILGNPAPSAWPPQVSISASLSPQAVANNGSATVVWGANYPNNLGSCTISTNDPDYPGPLSISSTTSTSFGPWPHAPTAGATYTYTLTCPVPANTVKAPATTMSVAAHLTVWPVITGQPPQVPLTANPNPTSISGNGGVTSVTWTPPGGATQCTLTSNGQGTPNPLDTVSSATGASRVATYTAVPADVSTNSGIVTFTATCAAGASPGAGQVTVVN